METTLDPKAQALERRHKLIMDAVDKWHVPLVRYVVSLGNSWADAEDILQETWKYVAGAFSDEHIIYPYLRRKAFQKACDHARKTSRKPLDFRESLPETNAVPFQREEPLSSAQERELERSFWSEFPDIGLSKKHKELLWMHARLGCTYQEIAEKTSIPKSSVFDAISIARKRFADYLNNQ